MSSKVEIFPFAKVNTDLDLEHGKEDTEFFEILNLLEKRLPKSCFVYNAVKISPRFPHHSKIYYMNPLPEKSGNNSSLNDESWIIVTHFTEDLGQSVIISAPSRATDYSIPEKKLLLEIWSSCPTSIFDWEQAYWFVALDSYEARLMIEISVEIKTHYIEIYPDTLMYMEKDDDATILEQFHTDLQKSPNLEVKRLDPKYGTEFMVNTWKFSKPNSSLVIQRYLELNESGGVYHPDDKPVSGILLHGGFGMLSMLYTLEQERGKGFAKMATAMAAREMLKNGLYPVSSIDGWNTASLVTHYKLGFKDGGLVQWIMYTPPKQEERDIAKNG